MNTLRHDLRNAARQLAAAPGFAAAVILTLAFGIAANTTAFSVINTLFLNPLAVERPHELVIIHMADAGGNDDGRLPISYLNLADLGDRNSVFQSLAGHTSPMTLTWLESGAPRRLFGELVTGNYFDLLGVRPSLGRFFDAAEDATPLTHPVLVMSHAAWQSRFGGAGDIIGRSLRINGLAFTVIGVAPPGFKGVNAVFGPDVWIPSMMAGAVLPAQQRDWLRNRRAAGFHGVARLEAGTSRAQAAANLDVIAAGLEREHPDSNAGRDLVVEPLTRAALLAPEGTSAATISVMLLAIPGLVLLIACSNIAHLLLARAAGRRKEFAVRLSIGASGSRLTRQLLTETAALGVAGGIVGLALAYAGVHTLWSFRPPEVAANLIDLDFDAGVFTFALMLSLATGLLVGVVPARLMMRQDLVPSLNSAVAAQIAGRRIGFGTLLTGAQVALSLVALVMSALLLRSLQQAYRVDPGFETTRLGIALVSPGQAGYTQERTERFYADVRARLAGVSGVVSSTWATQLPLFAQPTRSVVPVGREARPRDEQITTIVNTIDVDYFSTTGVPVLRGRDFSEFDRAGSTPVVIVNEALAARAWPGLDPVGRRLRIADDDVEREVVGVARTAVYGALGEAPQSCLYVPLRQQFADSAILYLRTASDPAPILASVQAVIRSYDPAIEIGDVRTIATVINQSLFGASTGVGLLAVFGALSLALASLGLYGTMAYMARNRRREIGIRMAIGATNGGVVRLMLRRGLTPVIAGIAAGALASIGIGVLMSGVLFGISGVDPASIMAAAAVMVAAAATACYFPARRASRVDPLLVLRDQ